MKLRTILFALALLAVISATVGGYLYYSAIKEAAFKEAEQQAATRVEMIQKNVSSFLSENIRPVATLAGMVALEQVLAWANDATLDGANTILDHFKETMGVDVCYLMDREGNTIASSNRNSPGSFVGYNYNFRPYFKEAMAGSPVTYLALGTISDKRGAYFSYPVYTPDQKRPKGVAVIKASIEQIEKELGPELEEIVLVTDPLGVVFIANRKEWLYNVLWKLSEDKITQIADSLQFGNGPWPWTGLRHTRDREVIDRQGNTYLMHSRELENYSGWKVIHLRSFSAISRKATAPLIRFTVPILLAWCVIIALAVSLLYKKASNAIEKRKAVETALRESEKRYRSLYHDTPAMLHSIDVRGDIVSVSDYWVEVMGYHRDEVIGRKLTDFFPEESRRYALETVFPEFFKAGFCTDISYQFIKKNGEIIDVLLSAIADRDPEGRIVRTLAVSIDVTERKRAEEALRRAKEELSRYSKDLEHQVLKRTREISSILEYTPAVVYIKDREGRYTLVNSRFEELFGVTIDEVLGKSDYEILPGPVADQLIANDQRVLLEKRSCQVEERIPQDGEIHTYLSVKFPIYDESGAPSGVCGISTDVTPVKQAQEQLRRFSASVVAGQEVERAAIARELHDELGQVLTALRMDAVWLKDRLADADSDAAGRALTMRDLIDTTIDEVRNLAIRLRPGVLDTLGLVDALEWYTADFERRTEIACIFEHRDVPVLDDTLATAAYRITQEALTNVARHAEAGRVTVGLTTENAHMVLTVDDDGSGFDSRILSEIEAVGVAGMRERAGLVGGELHVDSEPGRGTRIQFRVNLNREEV